MKVNHSQKLMSPPNHNYNPDQESQQVNSNMMWKRMKSIPNLAKLLKSVSTSQPQLRSAHRDMVPPASSRLSSSPKNVSLAAKSQLMPMVKSTTSTSLINSVQISTCNLPLFSFLLFSSSSQLLESSVAPYLVRNKHHKALNTKNKTWIHKSPPLLISKTRAFNKIPNKSKIMKTEILSSRIKIPQEALKQIDQWFKTKQERVPETCCF